MDVSPSRALVIKDVNHNNAMYIKDCQHAHDIAKNNSGHESKKDTVMSISISYYCREMNSFGISIISQTQLACQTTPQSAQQPYTP